MKRFSLLLAVTACMTSAVMAASVDYTTVGSVLSCGTALNCVPNGATSVTVGTDPGNSITLHYVTSGGSNIDTPSFINLGYLLAIATGAPSLTDLTGLVLSINVYSTPPGTGGMLPAGTVSGSIAVDQSLASINFAGNTVTTAFGTLPGMVLSSNGTSVTYQIAQTQLSLVPQGSGRLGTSIQGAVTMAAPEPSTIGAIGLGLALFGLIGHRRRRRTVVIR